MRAKSLDGLPLGEARVVVLDEAGAMAGSVRLMGEKGGERKTGDADAGGCGDELAVLADAGERAGAIGAPAGSMGGGSVEGGARGPEPCDAAPSAEGVIELVAPAVAGPASWRVALEAAGVRLAERPLPFSVTPALVRQVRLRVTDAATGAPLADASCYLYHRNLAKVRPIHAVSDADGWASALIVEGAPYNVRIECRGYREGVCNLDAGDAMTPAESVVRLVADVRDELDPLAARRGPAGY